MYYLIKHMGNEYVNTRSELLQMQRLSRAKFDRIDMQLDIRLTQIRKELDECWEFSEHPDTGEKLTQANIRSMLWLSEKNGFTD